MTPEEGCATDGGTWFTATQWCCIYSYEENAYVAGGGYDCNVCNDGADNDCDGYADWDDLACGPCLPSPVVIDAAGDGFNLTSAASGVIFDIRGNGQPVRVAWIRGDDAFLALDRNGDDLINGGHELFGNYTEQPTSDRAKNGFLALAVFDGNGDGLIDAGDAIFTSLRLWQDANHDGVSQPGELRPLAALRVASISLNYKEVGRRDRYGNQFRYQAAVTGTDRRRTRRPAYDVFLVHGR